MCDCVCLLCRLFVGIVFVHAESNIQSPHRILGARRIRTGNRVATVPVSQVHRGPAVAGPHVVRVHGGVAQLHLHGHQHHQGDFGGKRNENEGRSPYSSTRDGFFYTRSHLSPSSSLSYFPYNIIIISLRRTFLCRPTGSNDVNGSGQLVTRQRVVPEESDRVDHSAVDVGVFHYVRVAVRSGVPIFRPDGAHRYTHPVRDGRNIVLLPDISLLQKR